MDKLLTDDELVELSGLEQSAAQKRWLDDNGIFFFVRSRDGRPRTTWFYVNHPTTKGGASNDSGTEPDFGAIAHGS